MLTHNEIMEIQREAQLLIKIEIPDKLWEGGMSSFKLAVDTIRSNQEQVTTMLMAVGREHVSIKRLIKQIKFLMSSGVPINEISWPINLPNLMVMEDLEQEISLLRDNLKLMHGELTRARSDLRSKIHLLEMEARMGPSGLIPQSPNSKGFDFSGVNSHSMNSENDIKWDDPTSEKEDGPTERELDELSDAH
jgi:hypothetical protein